MRELNSEEIEMVSGGFDGIPTPGGGYISSTGKIFNGFGVAGATAFAFDVGYRIGSGINNLSGNYFGETLGGLAYDALSSS